MAVARALASEPEAILLDEPFSNLDAEPARAGAPQLREILARTGVTALFVTHDQEEALSLADAVGGDARGAHRAGRARPTRCTAAR